MLKLCSYQQNRFSAFSAVVKGPIVVALCALLLIQPVQGLTQVPAVQHPQSKTTSNPEVSMVQPADELPSAPDPQSSPQQHSQPPQPPTQQPTEQQPGGQQTTGQQPIGTAAAPLEKPTGVSGSRPAGAAIAPAKQRRVRAIVISLAVVLAGAGAIGAVAGLSKASHSQP